MPLNITFFLPVAFCVAAAATARILRPDPEPESEPESAPAADADDGLPELADDVR